MVWVLGQCISVLLSKLGWLLANSKDNLWSSIMKVKYFMNKNDLNALSHIRVSSHTWNGIIYGAHLLKEGCRWNVKYGKTVKFWKDKWLNSSSFFFWIKL